MNQCGQIFFESILGLVILVSLCIGLQMLFQKERQKYQTVLRTQAGMPYGSKPYGFKKSGD